METVGSNRTSKGDFRKNLARNAALSMLNNNMRQGDSLNANMGTGELAGAVRSSALLAEAKAAIWYAGGGAALVGLLLGWLLGRRRRG